MPTKLLQDTFKNAFKEFVDTRIGVILGTMQDDVNSGYSKHCDESSKIWHEILDILEPMGEEKRQLIHKLDGEHANCVCMAYDAIYLQAFKDGLACKGMEWKEVLDGE